MKVFVVMVNKAETKQGVVSELIGIFTQEDDAIYCVINSGCENYGYGSFELNKELPKDTVEWKGFAYFSEIVNNAS